MNLFGGVMISSPVFILFLLIIIYLTKCTVNNPKALKRFQRFWKKKISRVHIRLPKKEKMNPKKIQKKLQETMTAKVEMKWVFHHRGIL